MEQLLVWASTSIKRVAFESWNRVWLTHTEGTEILLAQDSQGVINESNSAHPVLIEISAAELSELISILALPLFS